MTTMRKVALYVRCSTKAEQNPEAQLGPLRAWAVAKGYEAVEHVDEGWSGAKARRPALDALLVACRRGEVQVVAVAALDRLARSTSHAAALFEELHILGVELVSLREAIDSRTPSGRALMQMAAVFAELERSLIVERVHAGIAAARRAGRRLGRPPVVAGEVLARARRLRDSGKSLRYIARMLDVSRDAVTRALAERA